MYSIMGKMCAPPPEAIKQLSLPCHFAMNKVFTSTVYMCTRVSFFCTLLMINKFLKPYYGAYSLKFNLFLDFQQKSSLTLKSTYEN
jgi:hypothetical protein